MKFGELTYAQIILSAFSGIAVFIISLIVKRKIVGRYRKKDNSIKINQKNNKVKGSIAGGNIIKSKTIHSICTNGKSRNVYQTGNTVIGDMAAGDILKNMD